MLSKGRRGSSYPCFDNSSSPARLKASSRRQDCTPNGNPQYDCPPERCIPLPLSLMNVDKGQGTASEDGRSPCGRAERSWRGETGKQSEAVRAIFLFLQEVLFFFHEPLRSVPSLLIPYTIWPRVHWAEPHGVSPLPLSIVHLHNRLRVKV